MKNKLDQKKIAQGLGSERRGKVVARSGYFGALELVAEVQARFHVPAGGGRPTDPRWTERRQIPVAARTLERLRKMAEKIREREHLNLEPMQLAGLLLERAAEGISDEELEELARPADRRSA